MFPFKFQAVLIIPAIYNRSFVKQCMTVLLSRIGFGHAFVVQDHVCATFGAGLSHACVIDVGDQKTSISTMRDNTFPRTPMSPARRVATPDTQYVYT